MIPNEHLAAVATGHFPAEQEAADGCLTLARTDVDEWAEGYEDGYECGEGQGYYSGRIEGFERGFVAGFAAGRRA